MLTVPQHQAIAGSAIWTGDNHVLSEPSRAASCWVRYDKGQGRPHPLPPHFRRYAGAAGQAYCLNRYRANPTGEVDDIMTDDELWALADVVLDEILFDLECTIGCDWPGCTTRGNPMREEGWLIANSSQHPDWPNHEGWYCPAHGAYITRWYERGRYRRRRF
jgi:hypothetical protein